MDRSISSTFRLARQVNTSKDLRVLFTMLQSVATHTPSIKPSLPVSLYYNPETLRAKPLIPVEAFAFVEKAFLTGSREICSPPVMDTDIDVMVKVRSKRFATALRKNGWEVFDKRGDKYAKSQNPNDHDNWFVSCRNGPVNIIYTESWPFFNKFHAAHRVAKRLNLTDKRDRIALFQAVLYANPC